MNLGISAAIAKQFEALHQRWITSPWPMPDGAIVEVQLRPHDYPEYQAALSELGIKPLSADARVKAAPSLDPIQTYAGHSLSKDDGVAAEKAATAATEIREIGFAEDYGVGYTIKEVEQCIGAVARSLVVSARCTLASRNGSEPQPVTAEAGDVAAWLASKEHLPIRMPQTEASAVQPQISQVWRETKVYLGGYPEGAAAGAWILKESILADRFFIALDPTESRSGSTPDATAIASREPASRAKSGPGSKSSSGAARTAAAQGAA